MNETSREFLEKLEESLYKEARSRVTEDLLHAEETGIWPSLKERFGKKGAAQIVLTIADEAIRDGALMAYMCPDEAEHDSDFYPTNSEWLVDENKLALHPQLFLVVCNRDPEEAGRLNNSKNWFDNDTPNTLF